MNQGDTLLLYGDRLHYNGDEMLAKIRENVVMIDNEMTLTTDSLNYDRTINLGYYFNWGMVEDTLNVLTSEWGEYDTQTNDAMFNYQVTLTNPNFVLTSDTLLYNTKTQVATIVGPSDIRSDQNHIYSTLGRYFTATEQAHLLNRSILTNDDKRLTGDSIYYDRNAGYGEAFDKVEAKHGHSVVIDVLRKYYHNDLYFDEDNKLQRKFQSLKQGCAVASWLADVLLYDLDAELTALDEFYTRYSDDMLYIGEKYEQAMTILESRLAEKSMHLNPKKVEYLTSDRWFKFLGYSIKGSDISLSQSRIKTFQREIERRTIRNPRTSLHKAINSVNRYLYKGDGEHSWATQILPVCNVRTDIDELNKFVMDCLRAVKTGKRKVGGLGYVATKSDGCIVRGRGRNVKANREKMPGEIDGYMTIGCMQKALLTSRAVYNTLVASL